MCCKTRTCSPAQCATISDTASWTRPTRRSRRRRRASRPTTVVEKLEKGYDSEVGEGGDRLSTGEKQLVSFARAVIADPRIFVLDEATSSIDTHTEQLIQNAISTLLNARTSFIIAHRLSTIRQADLILVVQNGSVVEQGTHDELMAAGGHYAGLYNRQYEDEAAMRSPARIERVNTALARKEGLFRAVSIPRPA